MSLQNVLNRSINAPNQVTFAELTVDSLTCNHLHVTPGPGDLIGSTQALRIANQSIPDTTATVVNFDSLPGTDSGLSYSAGTFTVVTEGVFQVNFSLTYAALSGNARGGWILFSIFGPVKWGSTTVEGLGVFGTSVSGSACVPLSIGDTIQIIAFQSSGSPLSLQGAPPDNLSNCTITRITST